MSGATVKARSASLPGLLCGPRKRFMSCPRRSGGAQLLKPLACQPLISFDIFRPRAFSDFGGQFRRGAVLVPAGSLQPVANELLVERRRTAAGLVLIRRPEPRAVRREHFVDQNDL